MAAISFSVALRKQQVVQDLWYGNTESFQVDLQSAVGNVTYRVSKAVSRIGSGSRVRVARLARAASGRPGALHDADDLDMVSSKC